MQQFVRGLDINFLMDTIVTMKGQVVASQKYQLTEYASFFRQCLKL